MHGFLVNRRWGQVGSWELCSARWRPSMQSWIYNNWAYGNLCGSLWHLHIYLYYTILINPLHSMRFAKQGTGLEGCHLVGYFVGISQHALEGV